jgi:hypothetical protein
VVEKQRRRADEIFRADKAASAQTQNDLLLRSMSAPLEEKGERKPRLRQGEYLRPVSSPAVSKVSSVSCSDRHANSFDGEAACRVQAAFRGAFVRWFELDFSLSRVAAIAIQRRLRQHWRGSESRRGAGSENGKVAREGVNRGAEEVASWGVDSEVDAEFFVQANKLGSAAGPAAHLPPPPGASLDAEKWAAWVLEMSSCSGQHQQPPSDGHGTSGSNAK